jgi:hypothetical protein
MRGMGERGKKGRENSRRRDGRGGGSSVEPRNGREEEEGEGVQQERGMEEW